MNRVPLLLPPHEREHPTYARLRDGTDPASEERRAFFDALWAEYVPFAPKDYPKKLRIEFHPRWWEMYLTVALMRLGFAVQPNPADSGPDVRAVAGGTGGVAAAADGSRRGGAQPHLRGAVGDWASRDAHVESTE